MLFIAPSITHGATEPSQARLRRLAASYPVVADAADLWAAPLGSHHRLLWNGPPPPATSPSLSDACGEKEWTLTIAILGIDLGKTIC
ncbi:MAG: hypothetical protein AAF968_18920, partial [Pseudomonadota bacterium]